MAMYKLQTKTGNHSLPSKKLQTCATSITIYIGVMANIAESWAASDKNNALFLYEKVQSSCVTLDYLCNGWSVEKALS